MAVDVYLFNDLIIFYSAVKTRPLPFLLNSLMCSYVELNAESTLARVTDREAQYTCYACFMKKTAKNAVRFWTG